MSQTSSLPVPGTCWCRIRYQKKPGSSWKTPRGSGHTCRSGAAVPYRAAVISHAVADGRSCGSSRQERGLSTRVYPVLVRVTKSEENPASRRYTGIHRANFHSYHHMWCRLRCPSVGTNAAEMVSWDDSCTPLHTRFREFAFYALG